MSFVANGPFSLNKYDTIGEKKDGSAKGVGSSFEPLGVGDFSVGTLDYFKLNDPLWKKTFTLALADNTHDLDADFTDCERSGADREKKFWSKFAFTMAIAGGFNTNGDISDISDGDNPLNYLQTSYSYLNRIPRIYLSDENYCTLGIMYDMIQSGQGSFQFIALNPGDRTLMAAAGEVLSGLLAKFSTDRGIPVIIDTSKGFTKMVEGFNPTAKSLDLHPFCYMRTAATIADPSTTPGVDSMAAKFGTTNVYCEYLTEGGRTVEASDLVGNVKIKYTELTIDSVTAIYAITNGPLGGASDKRTLIANTGTKHPNSINFVKAEFLNAQKTAASTGGFDYPVGLFAKQISVPRADFYKDFNNILNRAKNNAAVRDLMKTYTMGCARKRTSDAAQGDDCDKLPRLTFNGLNPDGKSINADESVTMGVMGVMVTIDRLLFARQLAKCPLAAAILDSGTHMIVYIPSGGRVKTTVAATAQAKSAEGAIPPKLPVPEAPLLTPDQKVDIENRLRNERRFRRSAIRAAKLAQEAVEQAATKLAAPGGSEEEVKRKAKREAKREAEEKEEMEAQTTWAQFFTDFFNSISPTGSGEGGGANNRALQLNGLYQTGGDPTDDLDLSTILSYLYTRGKIKERPSLFGKFTRIIDKIRELFTSGIITFRYYNDKTYNAVYMCNAKDAANIDYSDRYISRFLDGLRAADSVDPFDEGKPINLMDLRSKLEEVIFHIVYWDEEMNIAANFTIVRRNLSKGPVITLIGEGFGETFPISLNHDVVLTDILNPVYDKISEIPLNTVLWGTDAAPGARAVPSKGATLFPGGGGGPPSIIRAPFDKLSSVENLSETSIAVLNSLLKMLRNFETSFINYREGRDVFYNIVDDGFPLKMLPNIVMASSVEVYVFVRLMLNDYTAERAKTINYGLFEYCLYSQKDKNYIYTCLQDIKDYILGTNMYYITPTETDIIPAETQAYFADLFTRTVFVSGQIYLQTYELTNAGNYEAIYKLASDNYLTMGGFHELSEIFMAKISKILEELLPGVLSKYDEPVLDIQNSSKDVGMGLNLGRGTPTKTRLMTPPSPLREGRGGRTTNFKKSIKKQRTRKLTRGKKRRHGKKRTRKHGIKRRHHTRRRI
jgi:hypothetical protein